MKQLNLRYIFLAAILWATGIAVTLITTQPTPAPPLWFSVFGSRSRKSYVLFEHTPITAHPAAGWTLGYVAPILG